MNPFLSCVAFGQSVFITAAEREQEISGFGWTLNDGWRKGVGTAMGRHRGRAHQAVGRICTKAPRQERFNLLKDPQRTHVAGPGHGELKLGMAAKSGSYRLLSIESTQGLDFLPNATEEHCVLELRGDLQVYRAQRR